MLGIRLADGLEIGEDAADAFFCAGSFGGLCFGTGSFFGIPFSETFHAPLGIQEFLGSREERMACGTDIHIRQVGTRGSNVI